VRFASCCFTDLRYIRFSLSERLSGKWSSNERMPTNPVDMLGFAGRGRSGAAPTVDEGMLRTAAAGVALVCVLVVSPPVGAAGSRTVLSFGDSLGVGTDLYLGRYLPGWSLRADSVVSMRAADVPTMLRSFGKALPRVIVVSAGTNDDPAGVAGFTRIVREALAVAGPSRCVVWSTIERPPYRGVSYAALNTALAALDRRSTTLRVLDWAAMARAHPGWFGPDGVHPSSAGYRARAAAVARLVERC
jgi:hypothetical protein